MRFYLLSVIIFFLLQASSLGLKASEKELLHVNSISTPVIDTSSFCAGQRLRLKNASDYASLTVAFYWKRNGVSFSNQMEPVIRQAGIYTVYAESAGFTTPIDTDTVVFTRTLTPLNLTVSDSLRYCEGKTAPMITFNGYFPTDSIVRYDDPSLSLIISVYAKSPIGIDIAGAGTYDLYLVRKDTDGCESTSKRVTFVKNPRPKVSMIASDTFNCKTTSIILDASGSDKGAIYNYNWSGPAFQSGGATLKPVVNVPGSYILTNVNISTGCNKTDSIRINSFIAPAPGTPKSNIIVCDTGKYDLFQLMDDITPGGHWVDDDATGKLTQHYFNSTGAAKGTYQFTYKVDSINLNCRGGQSKGTFLLKQYMNPGRALSTVTCNTYDKYSLISSLSGADSGGIWTSKEHSSLISGGDFLIKNIPEANYNFTYRFSPPSECSTDTTNITVSVFEMKLLGTAIPQKICSVDTINLFQTLVGTERGGVWEDAQSTGNLHDSMFYSTGIKGGVYTFTYSFPGNVCPLVPITVQVATDTVAPVIKCKEIVNFSMSDFEADYLDVTAQTNVPAVLVVSDDCGKYRLYNNLNNDSTLVGSRITQNTGSILWTVVDSGKNTAQCLVNIKLIGIPNIFTPNGDSYNETWDFSIQNNYPNALVLIYDRWGNKVWQSKEGYPEKWDGKGVPPATYRYVILNGKEVVFSGYVTLVR